MQKEKIKKVIISAVCLLFILSLVVIYSNFHFHVINNGFLIFHSHPYDKTHTNSSPIKSHSHSSLEFLFYFSLINIDTVVFFLLTILTLTIVIKYLFNFSNRIVYNNPTYLFPALRAPPSNLCYINLKILS
jgi:hypothetical protein